MYEPIPPPPPLPLPEAPTPERARPRWVLPTMLVLGLGLLGAMLYVRSTSGDVAAEEPLTREQLDAALESAFATIRLRQRRTKGCGSRRTSLAMMFKLGVHAEQRWRRLNGHQGCHGSG